MLLTMKIVLTPEQKQQLEQMHNTERDRRVCDRIKAVLLASEDWSQVMISQALRIHESTVARHLSNYVLSEKLKPENGRSQSRLSDTQTMQVIEHLIEKTYFHTRQIITYFEVEFGVSYTVAGINKWLHHHGFYQGIDVGLLFDYCHAMFERQFFSLLYLQSHGLYQSLRAYYLMGN